MSKINLNASDDNLTKRESLANLNKSVFNQDEENLDISEEELLYKPLQKSKEVISLTPLNVINYLHVKYYKWNIFLRYFIDSLVISTILLGPLIIYAYIKSPSELSVENIFSETATDDVSSALKRNVYFSIVYTVFNFLYVISIKTYYYCYLMLELFNLQNNTMLWGLISTISQEKKFLRKAIGFYFAFCLSNIMYGTFEQTRLALKMDINIAKTFLLWLAIYNATLFVARVFIDFLTFDIRVQPYKKRIIELNYREHIFMELSKFLIFNTTSEYYDESTAVAVVNVSRNSEENYTDFGFFIKHSKLFRSEEDAKQFVNNMFAASGRKRITYNDVEEVFGSNADNVFKYLTDTHIIDKNRKIKPKSLRMVSIKLFQYRRLIEKIIQNRDKIFLVFSRIVHAVVLCLNFVILMALFSIEYKVFFASLGSMLLSVTFIFGDSIRNIYLCFLFLLGIRPYDINDWVIIGGAHYTVDAMDLFNSTMTTESGIKTYMPNINLQNMEIKNVTRSNELWILLSIRLEKSTTLANATSFETKVTNMLKDDNSVFVECIVYKIENAFIVVKLKTFKFCGTKSEIDEHIKKFIKKIKTNLNSTPIDFTCEYSIMNDRL